MSTVEMKAVEMAVYGKRGKRYPCFPPLPQTLEIAPRFPIPTAPATAIILKNLTRKEPTPRPVLPSSFRLILRLEKTFWKLRTR
jgi:hypothetical protein